VIGVPMTAGLLKVLRVTVVLAILGGVERPLV
jgi:hypothetical protein